MANIGRLHANANSHCTVSNPVHTSNNVEATLDFVAKNEISSFRQSRNKLNMFSVSRLCRKNRSTCSIRQCCFDTAAGVDGALCIVPVSETRVLVGTVFYWARRCESDLWIVCHWRRMLIRLTASRQRVVFYSSEKESYNISAETPGDIDSA